MVAVGTVAALEEEGDSVEVAVVMVAVGGVIVGLVRIDNGAKLVAMIDNSFNLSVMAHSSLCNVKYLGHDKPCCTGLIIYRENVLGIIIPEQSNVAVTHQK